MKKQLLYTAAVLLFVTAGAAWAVKPDIEPGILIQDGMSNLKVNLYSAPTCVDWNNDGAKDLVVGQIMYGYVWLYLNQGTDLNPVFNGGTQLQSNGVDIAVSWG